MGGPAAYLKKRSFLLSISIVLLMIITSIPLIHLSSDIGSGYTPTRSGSKAVEIVINNTRIISGGITQWGSFSLGITNRTSIIETRIRNNLDAPMSGVKVNLTVYWYDAVEGFSFDKGRVIHKDTTQVSLPSGSGRLSERIRFSWVPSFAGSYILNLSAHAPGDPREVTHFVLIGGYKYSTDKLRLTDGLWVGTEAWNCSTMDGWTSYADGSNQKEIWHVSDHYLGQGYEDLHTDDGVFWAGNSSSGNAPVTGFHNLVSPELDLTTFDPSPYDAFNRGVGPQIYFLYKYRGNISSQGPLGRAGIYHWIRYLSGGQWSDWEKLYDPLENWINISGNTSDKVWEMATRPYPGGDLDLIGIDLARYQGKKVQLRLEYRPSGFVETGYAIDDLTLIGKHRVDITPFEVLDHTKEKMDVDPGSSLALKIDLVSKLTDIDPDMDLRVDCVDASDFIDRDRNVKIDPQIIELGKDDSNIIGINISVQIPSNAPFGSGWVNIRMIAGGLVKDILYQFEVRSRRSLSLSVSGEIDGPISAQVDKLVRLEIRNSGNIEENINFTFLSGDDLDFSVAPGRSHLDPNDMVAINGSISIEPGSLAGSKKGYFLITRSALDKPDQMLERIEADDADPSWKYLTVEYSMIKEWSIHLYATSTGSTYIMVEDPPDEGTSTYLYELIVHNSGNAEDNVTFMIPDNLKTTNIGFSYPEYLVLGPQEVKIVKVSVLVDFPIPWGLYNFSIQAFSSGDEDQGDNTVQMSLSLGPSTINQGVFLFNGSLEIEPDEVILGRESLITFTISSFGSIEEDSFSINLWDNGKVISTKKYNLTRSSIKEYQISWTFSEPGEHVVNVTLTEGVISNEEGDGLSLDISSIVNVRYVDLYVSQLLVKDIGPDGNLSDIPPGDTTILVKVGNYGDAVAELATLVLEVFDQQTGSTFVSSINITLIEPGTLREVEFQGLFLEENSLYQVSVYIDNGNRWKDLDQDNDLKTYDLEVGVRPPEEPIWREPAVAFAILISIFIIVVIFFTYLIRRKLSG